jgi:hypothetical protein
MIRNYKILHCAEVGDVQQPQLNGAMGMGVVIKESN